MTQQSRSSFSRSLWTALALAAAPLCALAVTAVHPARDDEGLEANFFDRESIPWDELAFRSTHEALLEYFDGAVRRGGP